ncbi:MAG: hypothetical protein AAGF95_26245 [Chloroflexota bacterium]
MGTFNIVEIVGYTFFFIGSLITLVGVIWLLVLAFRRHILWGLGSFFIPLVIIVFAIKFWATAQVPFVLYIMGSITMILSSVYFFI